ncbi:shikimate transporter [compost metagenome]
MAEAFPARVRYSGISIAYQLGSGLTGGLTPMLGTFVASQFAGQWVPLALFFSVLALMSLAGVLGLSRLRSTSARPAALSTSQGIA